MAANRSEDTEQQAKRTVQMYAVNHMHTHII